MYAWYVNVCTRTSPSKRAYVEVGTGRFRCFRALRVVLRACSACRAAKWFLMHIPICIHPSCLICSLLYELCSVLFFPSSPLLSSSHPSSSPLLTSSHPSSSPLHTSSHPSSSPLLTSSHPSSSPLLTSPHPSSSPLHTSSPSCAHASSPHLLSSLLFSSPHLLTILRSRLLSTPPLHASSPLLLTLAPQAKGVVFNIVGGNDLTLQVTG
jgi:hypothetical protein